MSDTETSRMMTDGLSRILAANSDAATLARIEKGWPDPAMPQSVAALGFDIALVPEDQGGAELGWAGISGLFEVLGYFAAPVDLGEQIVARWAMARAGMATVEVCPAVAIDRVSLNSNGTIDGKLLVPWGQAGRPVLVETNCDSGAKICLIGADQTGTAKPADTVGRVPTLQLFLNGTRPAALGALPGEIGLVHANAYLRSGLISGALARVLEMTIEHCNTRTQFGRPIGKFQAVQQLVAQLAGETAAANAAVKLGGAGMDAGRGAVEVAVAKHRCSAAVAPAAAIAHEVHGAIGVTQEHILHYFTRRLWQWRDEAGSEHVWAERLGREVIAAGRDKLWPKLVSLTEG